MEPIIAMRPNVGFAARVLQFEKLRFSRVTISHPVLIVVRFGQKELRTPGFDCTLGPGDGVVIAQDQVFDITNTPDEQGRYQADWLVWSPDLIEGYVARDHRSTIIDVAAALGTVRGRFLEAFEQALDAVRDSPASLPEAVARHKLCEVLVWIEGMAGRIMLTERLTVMTRVRQLVAGAPDKAWTPGDLAARLAMSEATLRRRLAEEGTSLGDLIADVRMSHAMQLIQSTTMPISRIALDVGYESQSRFAIRFRQRFGFAPSVIRGHRRAPAMSAEVTAGQARQIKSWTQAPNASQDAAAHTANADPIEEHHAM